MLRGGRRAEEARAEGKSFFRDRRFRLRAGHTDKRDHHFAGADVHHDAAYIEELRAIIRNYQVVVCDRSVFDNLAYMERRCGTNQFIRDFLQGYAAEFPYDVIYKLPMFGAEMTDDGIRDSESVEFQADIYNRLNALLSDMKIEHRTLPAPSTELRKEWSDLIVRETLEALGRTAPAEKEKAAV